MKREIIISSISGLIITIITSLIPFGYYGTEIGSYFSTGFPLKTYQMFGDAGVGNIYAFVGNFIIWTIIIFLIILIIDKIKNR
jgi:large-conductance mechanosensitive channel